MLVKTLLNSVEKHKGFVYEWIKLVRVGTHKQLHIKVRPGKRCKGLCSDCRTPGPVSGRFIRVISGRGRGGV